MQHLAAAVCAPPKAVGGRAGDAHVRVIVVKNDNGTEDLGFDYPAGPVTPKPEKVVAKRVRKPKALRPKPSGPKSDGGGNRGSVPKVPLVKV